MQNDRILSTLGLAMKAGQVVSGEYAVEQSVKSGKAILVIVAEDASDNTRQKMINMTRYYEVPLELYGTREQLGHCIGKEYRAMVAILQEGFAKSVRKQLDARNNN